MFCMSCGTQLPDNARFCSSCGASVAGSASAKRTKKSSANSFLEQLTPEQQEELFQGAADDLIAPVLKPFLEALKHLESIAKNGPVTSDDVKSASDVYQKEEKNPTVPSEKNRILEITQPFVLAQKAEQLLRQRWLSTDMNPKEKKKMLESDWHLYLNDGMKGIMKTHAALRDSTINLILYRLRGLGQWLEDTTLKNLLFAMKLDGATIRKDELEVLVHKVEGERLDAIWDYVSFLMSRVKK